MDGEWGARHGGASSLGKTRSIHIQAQGGRTFRCSPEEIVPRRFGLQLKGGIIILEYQVPSHGVLAHHQIPIDVCNGDAPPPRRRPRQHAETNGDHRNGRESGSGDDDARLLEWAMAKARSLQKGDTHGPWLAGVATEQLARLIVRLQPAPEAWMDVDDAHLASTGSCSEPAPAASSSAPRSARPTKERKGRRLVSDEAEALRQLLFGQRNAGTNCRLPQEWLQGWVFEEAAFDECPFGLRQSEGGPCGVIAPVQAYVIRRMMMDELDPSDASAEDCNEALMNALTDILFAVTTPAEPAGDGLTTPKGRGMKEDKASVSPGLVRLLLPPISKGAADVAQLSRLLETPLGCTVYEFDDPEDLRAAFEEKLFQDVYFGDRDSAGVVLFLYSVLLTRGVDAIRRDVDIADEAAMIGRHNYCTQECVNLLLTGTASSNVFNGEKWLGDEGSKDRVRLRGIMTLPEVGFLSLFEAYGSVEVGLFMKEPKWPIWVVHAESHYSVLFAEYSSPDETDGCHSPHRRSLPECGLQDVWYYDPLGRQNDEKRISILPGALEEEPAEDDLEENGMIAKVIRTRWGRLAAIDWNGAEPVL
eukprot:gnl/TRDRNA2_/TRDRNA2_60086_c0_seq1.p1 gnl/TRDRNA2_/TRDRNA2_60086_c0~~gnl/TRDRNA2_/TRDRNA2_60086_c0_seq1.p1  ORF type:complete len:588 (+),score=87.71 gnl/TRDRNA2_/TRDRNA2_60086_c0_seq1:127-1890(+)